MTTIIIKHNLSDKDLGRAVRNLRPGETLQLGSTRVTYDGVIYTVISGGGAVRGRVESPAWAAWYASSSLGI